MLRIEDTDAERSSWEMVAGIVDGLRWLGLDWDEGPDVGGPHAPYFQSQRLEKYRARGRSALVRAGTRLLLLLHAARSCSRSAQAAEAAGGGWIYDRTCCALDADGDRRARGGRHAARRPLQGPARADDRSTIWCTARSSSTTRNIEDFVVLRSDGQPTYHLSVVVDDIDMEITHVVRGDDHISNTPKQVLLYEAFGRTPPAFAHVPLILGPDKKRLSKRHGATSVMEYHAPRLPAGGDGELPGAARLVAGRRPGAVHARRAVVARSRSKASAAATPSSIPRSSTGSTSSTSCGCRPRSWPRGSSRWLREQGLWRDELALVRRAWFLAVVDLFKPRVKRLTQFADEARPLLDRRRDVTTRPRCRSICSRSSRSAAIAGDLADGVRRHRAVRRRSRPTLRVDRRLSSRASKPAALIHATRVAVTGRAASPGLFEVLELTAGTGDRPCDTHAIAMVAASV